MALLLYQKMFIKELVSDTQELELFNLTDSFYKEFVNRNDGYMLFMLRPLRDVINSIIKSIIPYKDHIIYGCCVGYSNYDVIKMSILFDCDVKIKKPTGFTNAFFKIFDINKVCGKTVFTAQITLGVVC